MSFCPLFHSSLSTCSPVCPSVCLKIALTSLREVIALRGLDYNVVVYDHLPLVPHLLQHIHVLEQRQERQAASVPALLHLRQDP